MVWIPAGEFAMGGVGQEARSDEFPIHQVKLDGFWMDRTEVTNADFTRFFQATRYITTAEKQPEWAQLKEQLPPGTPKPPDSVLVAGAMVFFPTDGPVPLDNYGNWWRYVRGASWKIPQGDGVSILNNTEMQNHPVTQVSWFDAAGYAKWAGKRLPTEAEWEYASRGGKEGERFSWGSQPPGEHNKPANLWQGAFPYEKKAADGYFLTAPVGSYAANGFGLYDMIGNVWEWCADWYAADAYASGKNTTEINPKGPEKSYDPDEPYMQKKVVRGGSFLCTEEYCASYRPSARMKTDPYSGENHTGFRCVMSDAEWRAQLKKNERIASR
ncbi:MAG: formylglycine-generating enzyme family protein [Mucilaginibacter polytrichastri]|nr:formylglycine-generating enzyme family protein [Mucilaginibacter polytrichastri]